MPGRAGSCPKHQLLCSLAPPPRPRLSAEAQEVRSMRPGGSPEPGTTRGWVQGSGCGVQVDAVSADSAALEVT